MIKKEERNVIGSSSYLKKVNTHFLSIWNIFSVSSVFRLTRILNNLIGPNNHVTPQVWWRLSKASLPLVKGSVYCCSNHTANSAWFLVPVFLLLLTTHDINPFPPTRRQSACPKSIDDWWLKGCMWRTGGRFAFWTILSRRHSQGPIIQSRGHFTKKYKKNINTYHFTLYDNVSQIQCVRKRGVEDRNVRLMFPWDYDKIILLLVKNDRKYLKENRGQFENPFVRLQIM